MHSSPGSARDKAIPPRFSAEVELASGGMGFVEIARCTTPGYPEVLAVKRLLPHLGHDDDLVRAFLDEAWMTASLSHPNVVALVASGQDDRGLFLALELVRGPPLSSLIKAAGALPPDVAVYIARSMAAGLGAAHSLASGDGQLLGIVHRDVTPSNVLLGADGRVRITDFGVAKANRYFARTRTTTGVLKGKVPYMSPEYAMAKPVDARSDLYSLGVVLYEMLAGVRPFDSESDVLILRKITDEPARSLVEHDIDPELAHIVDQLLAKRPEDRIPDAETLAFELDAFIAQRGRSMDELQSDLAELIAGVLSRDLDRIESLVALLGAKDNPDPTAILEPSSPPTRVMEGRAEPTPKRSAERQNIPPSRFRYTRALVIGIAVGTVLGFVVFVVVVTSASPRVEPRLERVGPISLPAVTSEVPTVVSPTPSASIQPEKAMKKPVRQPVRPRRPCTKDDPDYPMCLKR
jgi:serine/threonine protein kinase